MGSANRVAVSAAIVAAMTSSCTGPLQQQSVERRSEPTHRSVGVSPVPGSPTPTETRPGRQQPAHPVGKVTLGFAGDVHFADELQTLLDQPVTALRPIAPALSRPDLMMVNLETAITERGTPYPKDYNFRTSPTALDALASSGVDVVTMANNHAVDYGAVGLRDTLAAARESPIPVVGVGKDARSAFRPYVVSVRGIRIAVLAATTLPDETVAGWTAGRHQAGVAVALLPRPELTNAVRAAQEKADVVVVYLHWGDENHSCPYWRPLLHARTLAAAGADVVVGSHAHVLLGAGWLGDTYVDYGLGNFIWYNQSSVRTGLLTLTVRDGSVVRDSFAPADIAADGLPRWLHGSARASAVADWRQLRGCTNLAAQPAR